MMLLSQSPFSHTENSCNWGEWSVTALPSFYTGAVQNKIWELLIGPNKLRSDFLELLGGYETLKPDWDGYDALPPFPEILERAKDLIQALPDESVLPIDDIFPNSNGTVTIEWLNSNKKCALEIGLSNYSCFLDMQNTDPVYLSGKDILVDIKDFTEKLKQFLG